MVSLQLMMNVALPLVTLLLLPIILPFLLLYRMARFIFRSIFPENVAGKVVLITGASSGIGEHLAYEYARRGACLVLAARRRSHLQAVAEKARRLGSPSVIVEIADVSKVEDCKRCVDAAVNCFGRLDHLVNNAGIAPIGCFEDSTDVVKFAPIMNVNLWGSVYCTHFAIPHLRKSRGKIIAIASVAGLFTVPRAAMYSASKAALIRFCECLRIEVAPEIQITIVTPGVVDSEITRSDEVKLELENFPIASTESCARAILKSICRGEKYSTVPAWYKAWYLWSFLCPEVVDKLGSLNISHHKTQ